MFTLVFLTERWVNELAVGLTSNSRGPGIQCIVRRVNVCGGPATAGQWAATVCGQGSGSFIRHFPAVRTGSTCESFHAEEN